VFGIVVKRAPSAAGIAALLLSAPVYGLLQWRLPAVPYLHRMLITFAVLLITMGAITWLRPLDQPRQLPVRTDIELHSSRVAKMWGGVVVAAVIGFFIVFR
jgi:solute:Na+ symporter, SSS family